MKARLRTLRAAACATALTALAAAEPPTDAPATGVLSAAASSTDAPSTDAPPTDAPTDAPPAGPPSADAPRPTETTLFELDPAAQAEVAALLPSGEYSFCSSASYRLWQYDKDRLCHRQSELAADCSGLAAACARPAWEEELKREVSPSWMVRLAELLGGMGGQLFRGLFWLALGLGVLYLARSLVRVLQQARSESQATPRPGAVTTTPEAEWTDEPASLLLERALAHLDRDPRRALHFAYAALLAGLAHAGILRVHRALTSGDYRRALRRSHPDSPAGGLLWDLDLARFQKVVDQGEAARLLARVRELIGRLGSVAALLLVFTLLGCSGTGDPEPAFKSTAPRGYALWEQLARARSTTLTRRLKRVTDLPMDTTTVVLMDPDLRETEWATLEHYVDDGGHLIVLGPVAGLAETFDIPYVEGRCTGPLEVRGLRAVAPNTAASSLAALAAAPADVIFGTCGGLQFSRAHYHGDGQITLVADASIFDNTSLALGENASFAAALLAGPRGHLEFIGPWTGSGAVHPLESIARSSTGPWLLHLLGALGFFTWWRGRRFGTPKAPPGVTRRSWLEHAQALSGHYQKQGDVGAAVARYASWALGTLGRRSGSSSRDLLALSQALTQRRGATDGRPVQSAKEVHQLLLRARAGAELGGDKAQLLRAYRVLSALVDDVHGRK